MKKMIFAAVAAFAMISVSNVFAFNGAQVANNNLAQVNDTVDTTVVKPATPVDTAQAPVDTPAAPAAAFEAPVDTTVTPVDTTQAPVDTVKTPVTPEAAVAE